MDALLGALLTLLLFSALDMSTTEALPDQGIHQVSPDELQSTARRWLHFKTVTVNPSKQSQPNKLQGWQLRAKAEMTWGSCPAWIQEYAAFHKQALANMTSGGPSSSTKLVLHECHPDTVRGCPGIGDRIRGLLETFKLAVHSKRMFLIRWESSAPLEDVLQPSLIDWRVAPKYKLDSITDEHFYYWYFGKKRPIELEDGSYTKRKNKLMTFTHPDSDCSHRLPGPDMGCTLDVPPVISSCVFHALFKPSKQLAAAASKLKKQLFGSTDKPYLAVHLRIGGFEGERGLIRGGLSFGNRSTEEEVAMVLSSAQDLAAASNITAPILVLTDNDEIRKRIQKGQLRGFVSTAYKAKHASQARGSQHREALMTSFEDLALLADATCFIGSPSGFSRTALLWGRHKCFLSINSDGKGGL